MDKSELEFERVEINEDFIASPQNMAKDIKVE